MSPKPTKTHSGYKSWDEYINELIDADRDKLNPLSQSALDIKRDQLIKRPPINDYLKHQQVQYSLATKRDRRIDSRWRALNDATINLRTALINGRHSEITIKSIELGRAIEALLHPTRYMQNKMTKAFESRQKSEQSFVIKKQRLRMLKVVAQSLAITRWSEDINKELRIVNMCHEVWPELVEIAEVINFKGVLPDRAESLKNWIRPVAPDWAKKRGAPKK